MQEDCALYAKIEREGEAVEVRRHCGPQYIRGLRLAHGFGFFINPALGVEPLVKAAERGDYVALAVAKGEIVGFLTAYRFALEGFRVPVSYDFIYDIATEVSRKWRRMGIGSKLLEATVTDPFFDDKVLLIRGNPDYWDCYGAQCRKYAMFIMEVPVMYYGFKPLPVKLPGDLFTIARVGPRAPVSLEELSRLLSRLVESVAEEFYF